MKPFIIQDRQFLTKDDFLGLPAFFHGVREKGHIVSEWVSTFYACREMANVQIEGDEALDSKKKTLKPEQFEKTVQKVLWKTTNLEIESIIRDVCHELLHEPDCLKDEVFKRASALKVIGDIYFSSK